MAHSRTGADRRGIEARERAIKALELRKLGASYRQIGDALGFSEQRAHAIISKHLAKLNEELSENIEAVRRLELERLDAMTYALSTGIRAGDTEAINTALKIMARRDKILGLDAPLRHELEASIDVDAYEVTDAHGNPVGKGAAARLWALFGPGSSPRDGDGSEPEADDDGVHSRGEEA